MKTTKFRVQELKEMLNAISNVRREVAQLSAVDRNRSNARLGDLLALYGALGSDAEAFAEALGRVSERADRAADNVVQLRDRRRKNDRRTG